MNIGEQTIVQGGLAFMQELLTMDSYYNKIKHQTMKKLNMIPQIHPLNLAQNTSKKHQKKFAIPFDEDSDEEDLLYESEGSESRNSHFSQMPSKEQQDEPELPKGKQSKRLRSVGLR